MIQLIRPWIRAAVQQTGCGQLKTGVKSPHAMKKRAFITFAVTLVFVVIAFTIAFLTALAANSQNTNNTATNENVRLRVTVLDVALLQNYTGPAMPTDDVNPRFALTLRIDSCVPAITNLKSGTVVTFAVPGPSLFLRGQTEKGATNEIIPTAPRKKALNLASADSASSTYSELRRKVAQKIKLSGKFNLDGKFGPYISYAGEQIYLVPHGSFSWGAEYEAHAGQGS